MSKRPGIIISDASTSSSSTEFQSGPESLNKTMILINQQEGVDTAVAVLLQQPPIRRRPVSAMASLPWVTYQAPREEASTTLEDDEDCAVESTLYLSTTPNFPSPIPGSISSLALSPPGLSPLNFNDGSPFSASTPSSTSSMANRSRFTFDHVPFTGGSTATSTPATASVSSAGLSPGGFIPSVPIVDSHCSHKSAFEVVSNHQNADEILQRVRLGTSCSSNRTSYPSQSTSTTSTTSDAGSIENKQYICEICNKDFKRPDILSRHARRHTGEKPFKCEDCGRFFSRSDHLRTHRRTHTDEKPYQCTICSYSARRRDVLTRHMATRHQTNAPSTHRNVRRCLSDGDYHKLAIQELRQRHQTNRDELDIPKMEDIEDDVIVDDD